MADKSKKVSVENLWRDLFQHGNLSHRMVEIQESENGMVVQLPDQGDVTVTVKRAAPVGANFMSDVYFVTATARNHSNSSFVKVLCLNSASLTAAYIGKWYHREIGVYGEWIPILENIRKASGLDEQSIPINTAKSYYVNLVEKTEEEGYDNDTAVVIEDLKTKGFTMVEPTLCHDLQHTQLAMKSYANYHALSIAGLRKLRASDGSYSLPATLEVFRRTPYYVHPPIVYGSMVLPNYSRVLRHFQHEEAAQWLDGLIPKLEKIWSWEDFIEAGPLTCVIHGDSWNNNLLFRYTKTEEGETPVEMVMIDWQIARCGHPSIDLCYYLFCGTSAEFRARHLNGLFSLYFATLKANLLKLGIDLEAEGYTEEQFLRETRQRFVLGMFMAFFLLPIILDSAKASKHAEDIKEKAADDDGKKLAGDSEAFENKQKNSWEALFQPDTITSNPVLSERLVQLILDVKKVAFEFDCGKNRPPTAGDFWATLFRSEEFNRQIAELNGAVNDCAVFSSAIDPFGQLRVKVERAVPKGTNFMSEAYFLTSQVYGRRLGAFLKVPPREDIARRAAFTGRCYHREVAFYEHWLPRLHRIRDGLPEGKHSIQLQVPAYYYGNVIGNEFDDQYEIGTLVVMEDLKKRGFRMNQKIVTRADDVHARLVTLALADYHALSITAFRQNNSDNSVPLEVTNLFLKNPYFIDPVEVFQSIILPNYSRLLRHFQFDDTAQWLDELVPKLAEIWNWEDFVWVGPLTCVLHGDCWSNNMLFRYSTSEEREKPVEIVMVDFQIARFGHPTIDLCYYLLCSTSTEFRTLHFDELLSLYFYTLKANLLELGIDLEEEGYTDEHFGQETRQRFVTTMLMAFLILPVIFDEDPDNLGHSLEQFHRNTESKFNENGQQSGLESLYHFDTISRRPHLVKKIVQLAQDIRKLTAKM